MKDDINKVKDIIISHLDDLVQKTEAIYLSLGRNYPLLLQELDRSIKGSSVSVNEEEGIDSLESVDTIISEAAYIAGNFKNSLAALYKRDGELFEIIDRGISEMGILSDVIDNIREISTEMELISLNAMTVALKSGTAGKAFSFITDELKKLSAQTIQLTEQLTEIGSNQLKNFENYREEISEAGGKQKDVNDRLHRHLEESFTTVSNTLKNSEEIMLNLSQSSKEIHPPLMKIMEEIQLQDIIRQSINHIYISLDQFRELGENWTEEQKMDELAFREMLPDLCSSVLKDVQNDLKKSFVVFEEQSSRVKSLLDALENQRKEFVTASLGKSPESKDSILALREESNQKIIQLTDDVHETIAVSQTISEDGINLIKKIQILQRQFLSFEPIITRFHNIIVASKIEVAKQAALGDMKDTVSNMTDLTEGIDNDISKALDTIKYFLKTTEKTIGEYSRIIHKEMPELKNLTLRTADNNQRLNNICDSLIDKLQTFSLFTPRFFTLYNDTENNRKKLLDLEDGIIKTESLLERIRVNARQGLKETGVLEKSRNWTIQSDRLNDIIEKFTIFSHKKSASDLVGTSVNAEEATESGEVTLF